MRPERDLYMSSMHTPCLAEAVCITDTAEDLEEAMEVQPWEVSITGAEVEGMEEGMEVGGMEEDASCKSFRDISLFHAVDSK